MRVLLILKNSPAQRYVVNLYTKSLIREVKDLINRRRLEQAMEMIVKKGNFEGMISDTELPTLEADLILSKTAASWDMTK
ncbi:MAG: hypothetical protein PHP46_00350 [Candidatus Omnitrophica bacterium]|nr:hypothetical protein [Candidatus Omnitrophota bacterium]